MQIGSSGTNLFPNPYGQSPAAPQESGVVKSSDQIANEYQLVADSLTPAERKLYDNLMFSGNYEAAKGIIAVGFLRSAGMYQDSEGNALSGVSLKDDLTRMLAPADPRQQKEILKLQDYLREHPTALELDPQKRGSLIDFKV